MKGVLDGVRVLELGNFIAGPYAAMLLADMGAEVVKIEPPETGDQMRHWGQGEKPSWWRVITTCPTITAISASPARRARCGARDQAHQIRPPTTTAPAVSSISTSAATPCRRSTPRRSSSTAPPDAPYRLTFQARRKSPRLPCHQYGETSGEFNGRKVCCASRDQHRQDRAGSQSGWQKRPLESRPCRGATAMADWRYP